MYLGLWTNTCGLHNEVDHGSNLAVGVSDGLLKTEEN